MQEILHILRASAEKLEDAGVESAEYDARLLLAHACGVSLADLNKALILGDFKDFCPIMLANIAILYLDVLRASHCSTLLDALLFAT